jgi:hypothetical protein
MLALFGHHVLCVIQGKIEVLWSVMRRAVENKDFVSGRSLTEILGSNPTGGMDICLLRVSCVLR